MIKIYTYTNGKFVVAMNNNEFESLDKALQAIRWWYEVRRNDKSKVFIVVNDTEIFGIVGERFLDPTTNKIDKLITYMEEDLKEQERLINNGNS
jgi:hypothetical protein